VLRLGSKRGSLSSEASQRAAPPTCSCPRASRSALICGASLPFFSLMAALISSTVRLICSRTAPLASSAADLTSETFSMSAATLA
jgi:hypothetical protein